MSAFDFFERDVSRGILHHKSKKLSAVISAIKTYKTQPSQRSLETIENSFRDWRYGEKTEYAQRGVPIKARFDDSLRIEGAQFGRGWGTVPLLNQGAANPIYNPGMWNDNGRVQGSTNCYAYACDDPHGHAFLDKPQPGMHMGIPGVHAGIPNRMMTNESVRFAVLQDDQNRNHHRTAMLKPLIRMRDEIAKNEDIDVVNIPGHYLIALVVSPGRDYHWYRQDRTGLWSHKPGHTRVTDRDASGRPIIDPRECDLGIYSFTCFYYAPQGGVRTASLGDWYDPNWHM